MICLCVTSFQVVEVQFNPGDTGDEITKGPPKPPTLAGLPRQESVESANTETAESFHPLKVKGGPQKRSAGYQAVAVVLTAWADAKSPEKITALTLNSAFGILAYGTETGLIVVDLQSHIVLMTVCTTDLYGKLQKILIPKKSPFQDKTTLGFEIKWLIFFTCSNLGVFSSSRFFIE